MNLLAFALRALLKVADPSNRRIQVYSRSFAFVLSRF
jgi:hypothetical protein